MSDTIEIIGGADLAGQLPEGWGRFRGTFGLGRSRWFSIYCGRNHWGFPKHRNEKRWVPWDSIVTINSRPVGALGDYRDRFGDAICYQINWAMRIPPTRFSRRDKGLRFAPLFAERHAKRLLRAIESPKSATHMLEDRPHAKPYELGIRMSFDDIESRWPHEHGTFGTLLDKRGDRLEVLLDDMTEPAIVRKQEKHSFDVWTSCEGDRKLHETYDHRANESRSRKAQRRARNTDGTFSCVGTSTTTNPDLSRDRTGQDVGQRERLLLERTV